MNFFLPDVPKTAYSPFEWPEYNLPSTYPFFLFPKNTGGNSRGVLFGLWPLLFAEYRSDTEPVLASSWWPRLVQWHRLTRTDTPPGWRQVGNTSQLCIGVHNNLTPEYTKKWKRSASRYTKNNLLGTVYNVESVSFADFAEAFAHSTVAKEIPTLELKKLRKRLKLYPNTTSLLGVRRKSDGKIVAGLSAFDSLKNRASHYGCGFYIQEVAKDHTMVILMDHWFAASLQKNLRVLHFGLFVPPGTGTGRSKTISNFKAQFITQYISYQPPLWRLMRKKIF